MVGAAIGEVVGGAGGLALQLYLNGGNFGCVNPGEIAAAAGLGALLGATDGLAAELLAADGTGEALVGGAQNALAGPGLANQLSSKQVARHLLPRETLTNEALSGSTEIIPSSEIGNPNVPTGFSKFSTQTFQSPAGDFQTHFYMNPQTGEPFYGLDYKSVFKNGVVGQ